MWIIPKHLPIYRYVQDTKALGVDCEEFSRMSEKLLMWRSKPSQSQTWSRRWRRVSYIQHLSTRTLKPSHMKTFVENWTSSLRGSLVSHFLPLVAELPQKIQDTFTPTSQKGSRSADQIMLFSKTSKGLSVAEQPMASRYSSMSSEIWKKEVIEHRGEYSQRLKLALHTSGRESLSWPTPATGDPEGGSQKNRIEMTKSGFKLRKKNKPNITYGAKLRDAVEAYENWPTADATKTRDWKDTGDFKKWKSLKNHQMSLPKQAGPQDQNKSNTNGKSQESPSVLNPNWVEQMMGLPVGWTQLPIEWID